MIFNEDTRVKIPATIHFLRLGYSYQSLEDTEINFDTKIFVKRFKSAIEKINKKSFSDGEIDKLLKEINAIISNNDMGKAFYKWLIDPIDKIKLVDFDNIENNDFAVADELPFTIIEGTEEGSFRPDINILINGIPLAFLEVKKPNNEGGIQQEFNRMINQRLKNDSFKKFFNMFQFVAFSNNMKYEDSDDTEEVKAGSFYTTPNGQKTSFSFFREDDKNYFSNYPYINISDDKIKEILKDCNYSESELETKEFKENLSLTSPCNSFITSVFDKERFMYYLKYGIVYIDGKNNEKEKHIMRYPQFFATRKIIERLEAGGKGGIIWHTQGSGKTGLTAFSNRIIKDYYAKKNINVKFFFVVDRLDLLTQASTEFKNRGLSVINCTSKADFVKELNKPLSTNKNEKSIGEICVVNIHKFENSMPQAKNEYNVNLQRVFFIDEAHRSYSLNGQYFRNLMTCDPNAIYIALTGTPILSKEERSSLKFGDYIHKYFYDKSIQDGYTLRIKKENIETVAKSEILRNLDIEQDQFETKDVYESDDYVRGLSSFIENDFINFRLKNEDKSIGGMIVCRSNTQAKKVHNWFKENSKLVTGLVLTDDEDQEQSRINKENQIAFRNTDSLDMLIVNLMLTTGYDAKRLKKLYLLRGPHAQSLLQTISRVNRPYKSPSGKIYKYGYIVDFIDIEKEYSNTIADYVKELEEEYNVDNENQNSLSGLVIDKEEINEKYKKYNEELIDIVVDIDNLEKFSKRLSRFNKETLLEIKRLLKGIKNCETEFILSRAEEYLKQIDGKKISELLKLTKNRINFINLQTKPVDNILNNKNVISIIYEFVRTNTKIMDFGKVPEDNPYYKKLENTVKNITCEIQKNKNTDDIKVKKLEDLLKDIFKRLEISDLSDLENITDDLAGALSEIQEINAENDRLASIYDGNFAFVKTYQDIITDEIVDKNNVEKMLGIIFNSIKDVINTDGIIKQGTNSFINTIKSKCTPKLIKEKIYLPIKKYYDKILSDLYKNVQLFR